MGVMPVGLVLLANSITPVQQVLQHFNITRWRFVHSWMCASSCSDHTQHRMLYTGALVFLLCEKMRSQAAGPLS